MTTARKFHIMDGENGLHPNMPREEYDGIDRVHISTLKLMDNPEKYLYAQMHEREPTDALEEGIGAHVAVFEPERFRHDVAEWTGKTRNGKEWDAFRAANAGRLILPKKAHERCLAIAKAVRSHRVAARYLEGGPAEVSVLWTHEVPPVGSLPGYRIDLKGRLDFLTPSAIVDLKTAKDASPDGFGRSAASLEYLSQAALYSDGYFAVTGKRLPFAFVAVEKVEPYSVGVYRVTDAQLESGRERYRGWLDRLHLCRTESRWPGYCDEEMDLQFPRWAAPWEDDEDAAELDLVIGG